MSWTDKKAIEVIKYLRDKYEIRTFIETGTFHGINARFHSKNFNLVMTCEKQQAFYKSAKEKLKIHKNVLVINDNSPDFLSRLSLDKYIFFLDAHFYDPRIPKEDRFIILKELESMKKFKDSIIIVHDFHNGLGGITYDGINLDINLLRSKLKNINGNFFFYTNTLEGCDIVKPNARDMKEAGLEVDYETLDNLNYAWICPRLSYRGILYCLPTELNKDELKKLGLRKWN